jgi:geranylgeranyl reductase family protein
MRVPSCEVLIVGAGPAGCAAAITGQRLGLNVVVVDKATFPRDKCCGDGLTTLALRELEQLGVHPTATRSWMEVSDIFLRSPRGKEIQLQLPKTRGQYAAVVERRELDAELVQVAIDAGVEIRQGAAFQQIDIKEDGARVQLQDGTIFSAKNVIAADGMWSPVRRALGCTPAGYRGDWHAFRQYFRADGKRSRKLWVWFEKDLLPGYAWSFPLQGDRVNVGFGVVRKEGIDGKQLAAIWDGLLHRPHLREVLGNIKPEGSHKAWPIPARLPKAHLSRGPVMFVGDAATATDPMTGEGIGQALESGRLAAQAVTEESQAHLAARRYETSVRVALQLDHRLAGSLSKVLAKPGLAETALRIANVNDWSRRNFARWMFEDYPRAALFTPSRWKRGLFNTQGAWVNKP